MSNYRLAKSLVVLREQINKLYPNRSKINDGWIGDTKHSQRKSDHNPNSNNVVQAIDITHDVSERSEDYKNNLDSYILADILKNNKDRRIKYIISNGRIYNPSISKDWRTYSGTNKHTQHVHISVSDNPKLYDDETPWNIGFNLVTSQPVVSQTLPKGWLDYIIQDEGNTLTIDNVEPGGSAKYGITLVTYRKYINPKATSKELNNITLQQVEDIYYKGYYIPSKSNQLPIGLDYLFFDTCINSGITGATKILQRTLKVKDDGVLGPITLGKISTTLVTDLINNFTQERLNHIKGHKYEKGLTNRILKVKERSLKMATTEKKVKTDDVVITVPVTETKPWYQSKVLWLNVLAASSYAIVTFSKGKINIPVEVQSYIADVIIFGATAGNIVLRKRFTSTKLV